MITMPTADLVGVLSDVIPFALDDDELPMLSQVRVEWDGEQLHALATDRIRAAISSWEPGDIGPGEESQDELGVDWGSGDDPWAIAIALADAKELVKVFKLPAKEAVGVPITFDYDAERSQARVARAKDTGHSGLTVLVQDARREFPDVRALLAKQDAKPCEQAVYTARYMADFAKVRPRGYLTLTFTGGLTKVRIGERFVGAIMPARVDDQPA